MLQSKASMGEKELQKSLQDATEQFQKLQKDLTKSAKAHHQLDTQFTENTSVKEELALLEPTAKVFKQVGPVLVPQELEEARSNVQKRLDWITSETKRIDGVIKEQEAGLKKQGEILQKLHATHQSVQSVSAGGDNRK
ncbi:hypothetical protein RvY_09809 [Ramazzottius varieornatus]|uniref:Probable prefoldin subunit 6 n=1 Tax=Ramazzottius varieornatus TaxID=947166 RepID=A0A1D1VD03_RAMVA|nr:hypothetical protein RvY_09809 [Ramazzottius varieornatus]